MTMVAEPKAKKGKGNVETLDNGAIVITDDAPQVSDAKPGDADFDWKGEYPGEKVFVHTLPNGDTIGLAAISEKRQPSFGFMRQSRKKPQFEQIMDMVEFIASPHALALLDPLEAEDVVEAFQEWSEWSKTVVGE